MANILVERNSLSGIADSIRAKNGTQTTYKPSEMAAAIDALPSGGITPTGTIEITQNGTVDVTQYASAEVDVPQSSTPTGTKQISITQNGTITEDVTNYASAEITVNVSGGGTGIMTLIGQSTIALSEYTDTANEETIDTGINISNTDYAWIFGVITCDSEISTSSEWGMTTFNGSRYTSNGSYYGVNSTMQKGSNTLSKAGMVTNAQIASAYGVWVANNTSNITLKRKCHSSACPKCRSGNYTIKVYGLSSI